MSNKINLLGYTQEQLIDVFLNIGLSKLDAKRVFPWIHIKNAEHFDEMSDVPLKTREFLSQNCDISRGKCVSILKSIDGTQKALLEFADGQRVETVMIPEQKRCTVCVSSQVGCAMGCKFCNTGTQHFRRNLSSHEIMAQIIFWKKFATITNVVFMGMGEPLLNFQNVSNALYLLLHNKAHNLSRNKITVSTCGIICDDFFNLADYKIQLAISLHAPNDEIRKQIMPIAHKFSISEILSAVQKYIARSNTEKVTFEYLLLKGINDSDQNAAELAKILKNIPCKVNVIMYNHWYGAPFQGTSLEDANAFVRKMLNLGIRTTIRKSKGDDILAACGQLKTKYETR